MHKTALLVVDMVRDFTRPDGLVFYPQNRDILPRVGRLLEICRAHGALVVFLRHSYRPGKPEKNLQNMRPNCIGGSGGDEIDPDLPVDEINDYVIKKRRYSGFVGTDLDLVLRENGVENVIVAGTKTNCCIRATVTDAYNLDYLPYVVEECVATNSEEANRIHLEDIRRYLGRVISLDDVDALFETGVL
ncbi:MAG: cysteine hydrolase [Clostridiales bacterium]|nr:cysteine hydrolase [Clostridiales bacterium]